MVILKLLVAIVLFWSVGSVNAGWQTIGVLNDKGMFERCVVINKSENSFIRIVTGADNKIAQVTLDPGSAMAKSDQLAGLRFDQKTFLNFADQTNLPELSEIVKRFKLGMSAEMVSRDGLEIKFSLVGFSKAFGWCAKMAE